ncbi:MAG: hypothetical protein SPG61_02300 [Arcanobacterium sp.]|nr:hypothetical protein [Arcanobacterium sp.]
MACPCRKLTSRFDRKKAKTQALSALETSQDALTSAYENAQLGFHRFRKWAAPKLENAGKSVTPIMQDVTQKISEAGAAAAPAAKEFAQDFATKATTASKEARNLAVSVKDDVTAKIVAADLPVVSEKLAPAPAAKKSRKKLILTGIILGAITTVVVAWKRSEPKEDPWAEAYWKDIETEVETDGTSETSEEA